MVREQINMMLMLFCQRGGIITAKESGQGKTYYCDGDELVREEIMIAPWFRAYKGLPTREGGTKIDLLTEKRNTVQGADWYAYEPEINEYAIKQYEKKGKVLDDQVYDINGAHVNNLNDHRCWVAVGPEILCPGYNTMYSYEEQTLSESQFKYGTEIDVVLQNSKNNEIVYIECIVGDVKGHTYPDGIYHTGDPYPKSNLTDKAQADGSYIEFITERDNGERNGTMSDYVVTDIIVYEREW